MNHREKRSNFWVNFVRGFRYRLAEKPGACLAWFCSISAVLWALQSALQKNILPNDAVESVCWGAKFQLGYFKHPPLAAWISYLTAELTGHYDFFQYLLDSAFTMIGVWFVYKLAREFFDKKYAAISALVLLFVHYYTPPLLVFCPNSIQFAFQPIMAFLFYRAVRDDKLHVWLLFGLISGLAFLGKYSAGILLACMVAGMIFHPQARKRFLSAGPYLAGLLFCVVIAPHLYWLYQHDLVCLSYIGDSVKDTGSDSPFLYALFILIVGIYPVLLETGALLVTCLPRHFRRRPVPVNRDALYWTLFFSVPPVLLYVILALTGEHVVAMWLSTIASWTGIIAVSLFPFRLTKRSFSRLFLLECLIFIVLFVTTGIDLAARTRDRIHLKPQMMFEQVD